MKVILSQHGGQGAGIYMQRAPTVIDSASLGEAERKELDSLVSGARKAPARPSSPKARDEMSYKVTIQDEGAEVVLSQTDTSMTPEFGQLLGWLQRYGRK